MLCYFGCPFWNSALHAHSHVDLAEALWFLPRLCRTSPTGMSVAGAAKVGGRGGSAVSKRPQGSFHILRALCREWVKAQCPSFPVATVYEKYACRSVSLACLLRVHFKSDVQVSAPSASPHSDNLCQSGVVPHPATWPLRKAVVLRKALSSF